MPLCHYATMPLKVRIIPLVANTNDIVTSIKNNLSIKLKKEFTRVREDPFRNTHRNQRTWNPN